VNPDSIKAIPVPAFVISAEDNIAGANPDFLDLFPQTQVGRSYLTVLRQPALVALIDGLRSGAGPDAVEVTLKGQAQGTFRATGSVLGAGDVLICLQDMNETAMAIQMRQNFVTDLGHELKTPLTAISGILETCQGDPEAMAHFLPTMAGEVDRMKRLVVDLLTLSQVESNERRSPNQDIVLQAAIEAACAPLGVVANKTGVRIETRTPEDPIYFQADMDEIIRAVTNLVENALRYGKPGNTVQITGWVDQLRTGAGSVSIEVSDDGPGVEAHHIPRLTERFYRVDSHRSRDSGGSGLGLAIVKHIVNHHRGRMTFESEPDVGSKVTLTLPLEQPGS